MSLDSLIRLSMKSAIELDRLAQGLEANDKPLKELADQLNNFSAPHPGGNNNPKYLIDPQFTFACTLALDAFGDNAADTELFSIPAKIGAVTNGLHAASESKKDQVRQLKEFCLLLHNNLLSEKMGTIEMRRRSKGDNAKIAFA